MVKSETRLSGTGSQVVIGYDRPAVIIGKLCASSVSKDAAAGAPGMDPAVIVKNSAAHVRAGADIVEVFVAGSGVDEVACLPEAVRAVGQAVGVPLCVGARDPEALDLALAGYAGRALVYLIDQQTGPWRDFLKVAVQRGAAVIVQGLEPEGVPDTLGERIESCRRVLREAISTGIARQDVVVDPIARPEKQSAGAAAEVLKLAEHLARIDEINLTLRIGGVSSGLACRDVFDGAFLARALAAGVTCPIADAARARPYILASDVVMGRKGALDRYAAFASQAC